MSLNVQIKHRLDGFCLDVDFQAPMGITALFGRSGSGKTSVVQAIAGLLRPQSGFVSIGENTVLDTQRHLFTPVHKRRIGYVFQEGRLFPHLTIKQNLKFSRWFLPRHEAQISFDFVVELLGIEHLLDRRALTLSGGEKQRVAIGRALLSSPRLLLMDEPLAALDEPRKNEILPYLERLRDETKVPIVYVSHSLDEVARLATTIVALSHGQSVLSGARDEVLSNPDAVPILGARAAGAVLIGKIASHDDDDGLTCLQLSAGNLYLPRIERPIGAKVHVRIKAHDIILALNMPEQISALNVLPAIITSIYQGDGLGVAVGLKVGDEKILARITKRSARTLKLSIGMGCYCMLKSTSIAPGNIDTA